MLPLILLLALGASEVGFLVVDYLTISNAAREGARTGAAAGDYVDPNTGTDADDLILIAVEQVACNLSYSTLGQVRVYRADQDGNPLDSVNQSNTYSGSLNCSVGSTGLTCVSCPWSPTSRNRTLGNLDYLAVEVEFNYEGITKFFPLPTSSFSERAVMRLEPDTRG